MNGASWAIGHPGAFGVCFTSDNLDKFIEATDKLFENMVAEPTYYVDYIYQGKNIPADIILEIANMKDLWGTNLDESLIAIEHLKVTPEMVTVYAKKTNTIKISAGQVDLMLFNATDQDIDILQTNNSGVVEITLVGKCN